MPVLEFPEGTAGRLAKVGVVINGLQGRLFVNSEIVLEAPCQLQGRTDISTHVQVGAFTSVFGGLIRHCQIGRYCSIAPDVQIGWDDHPVDWLTSSMTGYVENVHGWAASLGVPQEVRAQFSGGFRSIVGLTSIGHDVWIGHGVFIRSGISIGNGAVVAAGSVVTKDVSPYTIVGGNPARAIRDRFTLETAERIEASGWWRYNIYDLAPGVRDVAATLDWIGSESAAGRLRPYEGLVVDFDVLERLAVER
jgi:acetyltransferase-like isoleucine patch superfamily enzyme